MHVEAFVLLKPSLHCRGLVRGIVVHYQVQLKIFGRFSINLLKKFYLTAAHVSADYAAD
jgi:hypothetical protein